MYESLAFFGERLTEILSPKSENDVKIITKGLILFRQGLVLRPRETGDFVYGTVQDVSRVNVTLDLTFPSNSTCDCPAPGICRHQLAVFFAAYNTHRSVSEWVEDWKQSHPTRAVSELAIKRRPAVKLDNRFEDWKEFFIETAKEKLQLTNTYLPYTFDRSISAYQRTILEMEPDSMQWRHLYRSIGYFYGLLAIFDWDRLLLNDYHLNVLNTQTSELMMSFEAEMEQYSRAARPFDSQAFHQAWLAESEQIVRADEKNIHNRWQLYRTIWTTAITDHEQREQEGARLSTIIEQTEDEALSYLATWCRVHLHLVEQQDDSALTLIKQLGPSACHYVLFLLEEFAQHKTTKRAIPFIDFFIKQIRVFLRTVPNATMRTHYVYAALQIIRPMNAEQKRFDLLEKMLRECLPYSVTPYSHFLFEKKDYKRWIELQATEQVNIIYEWPEQAKLLQKEEPHLLLPIYHQNVIGAIEMKNRHGYREATRYLKKMRTIYKKMKDLDRWESYIDHLQLTYRRLRAFQEELRKGKLIDAAN